MIDYFQNFICTLIYSVKSKSKLTIIIIDIVKSMMIVSLLHIIYSIQASSKVNDTSSLCKEENGTALQGLRNGTMYTSG